MRLGAWRNNVAACGSVVAATASQGHATRVVAGALQRTRSNTSHSHSSTAVCLLSLKTHSQLQGQPRLCSTGIKLDTPTAEYPKP